MRSTLLTVAPRHVVTSRPVTMAVSLERREAEVSSLMPPLDIAARVVGLVIGVLSTDPWECSPFVDELERWVRVSAAHLRDRGCLPERVIIALKLTTSRATRRGLNSPSDRLHDRMVRWSLREYFRYDG